MPGARQLGTRLIPDRAAMVFFTTTRPDALRTLRTSEDIFAVAGYAEGIREDRAALDRVRAAARSAPFMEQALQNRVRFTPGSRAGRRLGFRVVARLVGSHEFRRVDFQHAVERGVTERGDHTWRLDQEAELELWATLIDDELVLGLRLSDERMRHREYKAAHRPASLRPPVAAAMAWLSEPRDDDVVLDPMCGAGTILIERALLGRYASLIGADSDPAALAAARTNVGPRYKPIELWNWDAVAMPLADASVSKIVTNLPWGMRLGSHGDNRRLYPRLLTEFRRVLRLGGLMVLLTAETFLMRNLCAREHIRPSRILNVSILGARAAVYVIRNGE